MREVWDNGEGLTEPYVQWKDAQGHTIFRHALDLPTVHLDDEVDVSYYTAYEIDRTQELQEMAQDAIYTPRYIRTEEIPRQVWDGIHAVWTTGYELKQTELYVPYDEMQQAVANVLFNQWRTLRDLGVEKVLYTQPTRVVGTHNP